MARVDRHWTEPPWSLCDRRRNSRTISAARNLFLDLPEVQPIRIVWHAAVAASSQRGRSNKALHFRLGCGEREIKGNSVAEITGMC